MEKIKIKIKKLNKDAILPHYEHKGDAGMDVYSAEDKMIKAGEKEIISTGLAFEIPEGYEIQVRPKSGLSLRHGLTLPNAPGTLDSGYRGELKVVVLNLSDKNYKVEKGKKIAQLILAKYEKADIEETEELSESERGSKGFGSTGLEKNKG
jgi:dUTP pyrophosphatase